MELLGRGAWRIVLLLHGLLLIRPLAFISFVTTLAIVEVVSDVEYYIHRAPMDKLSFAPSHASCFLLWFVASDTLYGDCVMNVICPVFGDHSIFV